MELGKRIAEAREARGMSLQALAARLAISKATAGHWETGARSIKHHDLAMLCRALDVSADQLLFDQRIWPFASVDPAKVVGLEPEEIQQLQGALLLTSAHIGIDIAKQAEPTNVAAASQTEPKSMQPRAPNRGGAIDVYQTNGLTPESILATYNKMDSDQQFLFRQLLRTSEATSEWDDTTRHSVRTTVVIPQGKEGEQPAKQSPTSKPTSKRSQP